MEVRHPTNVGLINISQAGLHACCYTTRFTIVLSFRSATARATLTRNLPSWLAKQAKRTLLVTVKAELAEVKQQAKSAEAAKAEVSWQLKQCASQQTQLKVSHAARRTPSGGRNGSDPRARSTQNHGWRHPYTLERPVLRLLSER